MAALLNSYLTKEKLELILNILEKKGLKGIGITIGINNELNKFDQDVAIYISQSKEDRDQKKSKYYFANGQVVWTDGIIEVKGKQAKQEIKEDKSYDDAPERWSDVDGLPF